MIWIKDNGSRHCRVKEHRIIGALFRWRKTIKQADAFYKTKRWQTVRASILKRDGYMCQLSKRYGKRIEANTVHHIFPREDYPEYQWCEWNLISLSHSVHDSLHYRQTNELTKDGIDLLIRTARKNNIPIPGRYEMHRTLIVGLAGTGKTTYAKEHMTDDTLVYDLDAIASAFRLKDPHEEYHKAARTMANDFLYGFIERVSEYTSDAIIIRTAPSIGELERISPDLLVVCSKRFEEREMDDVIGALNRIDDAIKFCERRGIVVRRQ